MATYYPDPIQNAYQNDNRVLLAQALQRNQQPVATPIQGLSNLTGQLLGAYQQKQAKNDYDRQSQEYNKAQNDAFARLLSGDAEGAYGIAASNPYSGDLAKTIATLGYKERQDEKTRKAAFEDEERKAQRAFRDVDAGSEIIRYNGLGQEVGRIPKTVSPDAKLRAERGESGGSPYFMPLQTSTGVYNFNARTGQIQPLAGQNGQPLLPQAMDPHAQAAVAGAKAEATAGGKAKGEREASTADQAYKAPQTEILLQEAERLLPESTGSGLGTLADAAAAMVGKTTKGGEAGDQLKIIAGKLTSQVPRMEGPQSNLDVKLYKEMAGDLGNTTLPIERRMAALQTLRQLNAKYAHLGSGAKTVTRTGRTPDGKRVKQYSDGTVEVE